VGRIPAMAGQLPEDLRLEQDFRPLIRQKAAARAFDVAHRLNCSRFASQRCRGDSNIVRTERHRRTREIHHPILYVTGR
jgi:hypothetical protein